MRRGGLTSARRDGKQAVGLRGAAFEQVENDPLLRLRLIGARATSAGGQLARSHAVEPLSLVRRVSAPRRRSASTAAEQRFRTARWSGVTPPAATALGSPQLDEGEDHRPLIRRVPTVRTGHADGGRMQWLSSPSIAGSDVRLPIPSVVAISGS